MSFYLRFIRFHVIHLYMIISNVVEAASTNIFFFIIYNSYHTANQLCRHSHTSRTIASSQHHPRETRPLLSQPNLYKISYIGIPYVEFVSYIERKRSIVLLIRFLTFIYFFFFPSFSYYIWSWINRFAYSISYIHLFLFLSFIFILYMKSYDVLYQFPRKLGK